MDVGGGVLVDATALLTVTAILVSLLKPFVEQLPWAHVGSSMHDATIQLLNLLINVGLVLAVAAANGGLTWHAALALALQALGQFGGAHVLYTVLTRSGGSINDQQQSAAAVVPLAADQSPL